MKGKVLYPVSIIVIAVPWLFLLEILPVPYSRITTAAEVTMECIMFAALLAVVILLRKGLKRMNGQAADRRERRKTGSGRVKGQAQDGKDGAGKINRVIAGVLFTFASITLFLVGLILVLIAISFTL